MYDLTREQRRLAWSLGYTELRFNPATLGWAWHRPDQVLGADGRLYVAAAGRRQ